MHSTGVSGDGRAVDAELGAGTPARSRSVLGWTIPGHRSRGVDPRFSDRGETSVVLG